MILWALSYCVPKILPWTKEKYLMSSLCLWIFLASQVITLAFSISINIPFLFIFGIVLQCPQMNFHSFQNLWLCHWISRLLTFGFLTWIPLVADCQTIKPKEHVYNRTHVTGSGEINQESEALNLVLGFASDFQHNIGKLSFHLVLLFPQYLKIRPRNSWE